jgi:hypothetical protein
MLYYVLQEYKIDRSIFDKINDMECYDDDVDMMFDWVYGIIISNID